MYALLPAMSGASGRLIDAAIDEMVEYYQDDEVTLGRDLRWMGIMLRRTDCVLEEDKRMIQERLSMYDDLMEKDPEMQRLRAKYKTEGLAEGLAKGLAEVKTEGLAKGKSEGLAEGKFEGLAEGRAEGLAEGEARTLQEAILTIIEAHFPTLTKQAQRRVALIRDTNNLRELFRQLLGASDEVTARERLGL